MKPFIAAALVVISSGIASNLFAAQPAPLADRNVQKWSLKRDTHLAIEGYDPVAYFPVGGGKPAKGDASITCDYNGARYRFVSAAHKDLFLANPAQYEPAYGGWCAWAMKDGEQVEVDPKSFIIKDDRLFLFYDGILADTRAKWLKDNHERQAAAADVKWKDISGESPRTHKTLKEQLDAKSAAMNKQMTPEQQAAYEKALKDIAATGVAQTALKVGGMAPEFELPDTTGTPVSLKHLLEKGPVVLTWYRGGWCPYCNIQLHAYQDALDQITAAGGQLVAVSPQTPDNSMSVAEKQQLKFPVLSDVGNKVAMKYGIAYTLPKDVAEMFKSFNLDLAKLNGDDSNQLPISATYVINSNGTVVYAFVNADYRTRAEPADIVAALEALKIKR